MAAPTVPAGGVGAAVSGTASITPPLPAPTGGFLTRDLIIGVGECFPGTAPGAFPTAASNGFENVTGTPTTTDTATKLTAVWRRWTAGLTAHAWGDAGDHGIAQYIVVRGVKSADPPWNVSPAVTTEATLDNSALWSAVVTTVDDCLVLLIGAWSDDFTIAALPTGGTGLTGMAEHIDSVTASGNDGAIYVASAVKAAFGSTGTPGATLGGNATKALMTLALEPAGAPPANLTAAGTTTSQGTATLGLAKALTAQGQTASQGTVGLLPFTDDFTGTDGAAPKAVWSFMHRNFLGGPNVNPTIQSNRLRFLRSDAGGNTTLAYLPAYSLADSDQTVSFVVNTGQEREYGIFARYNGAAISASSGSYYRAGFNLAFGTGAFYLIKVVNGVQSTRLDTNVQFDGVANGTTLRLRFQMEGSTLRAKLWNPGVESQPAGWGNEVTDTDLTGAGYSGIFSYRESNLDTLFDDYLLDRFAAAPPVALTATGTTTSQGAATLSLAAALTASGQTSSGGTAALSVPAALTAAGQTASGGTAAVTTAGPPDAPDAILDQTNLAGPVQRTWAPSGGSDPWLTATDPAAAINFRASFPTPAIQPGSGGPVRFQMEVRRPASAAADPRLTLELWEAGLFRATVATDLVVSSTTSQILEGTMDPAWLSQPTGAQVELRATSGPTDPAEESYGPDAAYVKPAGAVDVAVGELTQALIDANPAGTVFWLLAGNHQPAGEVASMLVPKNNMQFHGQPGARVKGCKTLSGWTSDGAGRWYVDGQTQRGIDGTQNAPSGNPVSPADALRSWKSETVWIDDVIQKHQNTLAETTSPGEWFFDYDANRIYIATDPAGKTVETSIADTFLDAPDGAASGVRVVNLTVEKFMPRLGVCVIDGTNQSSWQVSRCLVQRNHGGGVRVDSFGRVYRTRIFENGQIGAKGAGASGRWIENELAYNNTMGIASGWEAGATKWVFTSDLWVIRQWSHHNKGPGLWTDIDNRRTVYEGNLCTDNARMGIFHEINLEWAIIRRNRCERNGTDIVGQGANYNPEGCGITVNGSPNVQVYDNDLVDNAGGGIAGVRDSRSGVTFDLIGLWVHDNRVTMHTGLPGVGAGLPVNGVLDQTGTAAFQPAANNRFEDNDYTLGSLATAFFQWNGGLDWSGWQAAGQDVAGSAVVG